MPKMNLTGRRFGRLTVVGLSADRTKSGETQWICRCDCGEESPRVRGANLKNGHTSSCGCLLSESGIRLGRKYGPMNKKIERDSQ